MQIADSERLQFRLMDDGDAQLLFDLDQNPEVMRYINGGIPTTWEQIQEVVLPRVHTYTNAKLGWGVWLVFEHTTGQFIGWILIRPMRFFTEERDDSNLEIGWRFKQSAWGKGYATEAAIAVVNKLVEHQVCTHFSAVADKENTASQRVMEKLGMQQIDERQASDEWSTSFIEVEWRMDAEPVQL